MKIIATDNYNRDYIADHTVATNVTMYVGEKIVSFLNQENKGGDWFYKLVEDDYILYSPYTEELRLSDLPILEMLQQLLKEGFEITVYRTIFCEFVIAMHYRDKVTDKTYQIKRAIGDELIYHNDPKHLVKDTLIRMSEQLKKEVENNARNHESE